MPVVHIHQRLATTIVKAIQDEIAELSEAEQREVLELVKDEIESIVFELDLDLDLDDEDDDWEDEE